MNDSFYIGAYWGARKENLRSVTARAFAVLTQISKVDVQFSTWYELGMSRGKALERRVELSSTAIEELFRRELKKGELEENGFSKNGFSLGLWTGQTDEQSSNILFMIGSDAQSTGNSCVLKIPFEGEARQRLLYGNKSAELLSILVKELEPDFAVLTSRSLRDRLNIGNEIGWITYRKEMRHLPISSKNVIYKRNDYGHWFYSNPEDGQFNIELSNNLLPIKESL